MKRIILFLVISLLSVNAQNKNADEILNRVKEKLDKVSDYNADITMKIDVSFLKVPGSKAKLYFKKPDKMKFDSKGFALLPKEGINFSPVQLLAKDFNSIYEGNETIEGKSYSILKLVSKNDSLKEVIPKVWIDDKEMVVTKVEVETENIGKVNMKLEYKDYSFGLPSKVSLNFDMSVPESEKEKYAKDRRRLRELESQNFKGEIVITYSNYKINTGLTDQFFIDENKEKK